MVRLIPFLWRGLDAKLMVDWAFSGLTKSSGWNGKFLGANVVETRKVVKSNDGDRDKRNKGKNGNIVR